MSNEDIVNIRVEKKYEDDVITIIRSIEDIIKDTGHGRIEIIITDNKIFDIQPLKTKKSSHWKKHRNSVNN